MLLCDGALFHELSTVVSCFKSIVILTLDFINNLLLFILIIIIIKIGVIFVRIMSAEDWLSLFYEPEMINY